MRYKNQSILLASKHEKEQAISEPFRRSLSCTLHVHDFDTDQFGTFSGEIPRRFSPYETCLLKAKTAAKRYNYPLALASEGSFGPHPTLAFVPSAQELMIFVDRTQNWVIAEQLLTHKTNYAMMRINRDSNVDPFLKQVQFPSHALIIQTASTKDVIAKGVNNLACLNHSLELAFHNEKELLLATDMRAMVNPTRMAVIAELADKLAQRIARLCARCEAPGFGFKATRGLLPCSLCGAASSFYKEELWGCIVCDYEEYKMRQDALLEADPSSCNYCNP